MSTPYAPFLAGQELTADELNTLLVQEMMPWTPLTSLGAFATNFTPNTVRVPEMRKIVRLGTPVWEFKGTVNCTSFTANTIFNFFTFTSNTNWVASERERQASGASTSHYSVRLGWQSTGTMSASVPTAAGSGMTNFWIDAEITDPKLLL